MAIIKAQNYAELTQTNAEIKTGKGGKLETIQKHATNSQKSSEEPKNAPISPALSENDDMAEPEKKQTKANSELQEDEEKISLEDSTFTLEDVKKCWNQAIVEIKPLNHSLSAILQSCHPIKAEKGVVSISAKFPFHKDKLNDDANRLTMESVFAKILGFRLRIKADTGEQEVGSRKQEVKEKEKPRETSSLLTQALDIIGGTVVE
jgi:hypothetical protein